MEIFQELLNNFHGIWKVERAEVGLNLHLIKNYSSRTLDLQRQQKTCLFGISENFDYIFLVMNNVIVI